MTAPPVNTPAPATAPTRFLSRDGCQALANHIFALATGGGTTMLQMNSTWTGSLRWGRNVVTASNDSEETSVMVRRTIRGANSVGIEINTPDDEATLRAAVARAEATVLWSSEDPEQYPDEKPAAVHPHAQPHIWFDATYQLDATARSRIAAAAIAHAEKAGLLSAAYLEVAGHGESVISSDHLVRYYPRTTAQYSMTVRDLAAGASGWAGVDFADWSRIDPAALTKVAVDKCVASRNPVAVEPGRYVAILEPQAVCDLVAPILDNAMERIPAEQGQGPFALSPGQSKIGLRVLDPRLTLNADPMDPDGGFVPFDWAGEPYLAVDWIKDGVLRELAYPRDYGLRALNKDQALPNSGAFRLQSSGAGAETATVEEMIADTQRGLLVTRFSGVQLVHFPSMLLSGNTRDGLWLIERGKISKPVKNFRFTESPFFAFNSVEAIGAPQRVFRPAAPAICPPIKVRDFSFTGLMDAV